MPKFSIGDTVTAAVDIPFSDKTIKKGTQGLVREVWELRAQYFYGVRFDGDMFDRLVQESDLL
jgi:hypothetical protein